jgi:hypothetical protein
MRLRHESAVSITKAIVNVQQRFDSDPDILRSRC